MAVKDTRGGMTTQSCSITATNYTTPHDVIFPHKTGIIMVPEVSKIQKFNWFEKKDKTKESLCIVGVSIVCHLTDESQIPTATNAFRSTWQTIVVIAIIPHRLKAISQKLYIYIYYDQGNMNSWQRSRCAFRPHQIVRPYAITPTSFSAQTHVPYCRRLCTTAHGRRVQRTQTQNIIRIHCDSIV